MRLKCTNCGFVNFPRETSCKRCKSALAQPLECHNVWRDGKSLVVSISEHLLPKRCLKCGTADYVDMLVLELVHTPLPAYVSMFLSFAYWTEIELYGFFCGPHRSFAKRQTFLLLPNALVVGGILSVLASLVGDDFGLRMMLFFGGGVMLGLGILFIKLASGSIKVVKRNKKYVWLQGVDQNLLAQLEDFAPSKRQYPLVMSGNSVGRWWLK